jgi:hypothetical protein
MAEDSEKTGGETPAPKGNSELKSDLPTVESPPLSPASETPVAPVAPETAIEPVVAAMPENAPKCDNAIAPPARARFRFKARHKRTALLAASVAIAAALGVLIGALASGQFATPARKEVASLSDRQAMQRSIGKLSKEVAALKASLEAANKSASSPIAKTGERLSRASAPETTGSIPVPLTAIPTPMPRPSAAEIRPPVVRDWSIRYVRDGFVYVQGRGDVYQAQLGAPLPGLGPVQEIKRQDGRWLVLTPKGLIVSMRDRRYFEQF